MTGRLFLFASLVLAIVRPCAAQKSQKKAGKAPTPIVPEWSDNS